MTRRPQPMRLAQEVPEVGGRAVVRMHAVVVGDVVAVVLERRRVERQQPHRVDAEVADVRQALRQPGKVADAVVVAVAERLDVHLVDDRVLVPERISGGEDGRGRCRVRGTLLVEARHACVVRWPASTRNTCAGMSFGRSST